MSEDSSASVGQHYGLIVHQEEKVPRFLAKYVNLLLNYQYGLPIRVAPTLDRGMLELGRGMQCAFVVQDSNIRTRSAIQALSQQDQTPLFLMFPAAQLEHHETLCRGMANVHFCAWEDVFRGNGSSLQQIIEGRFTEVGIGNLFRELDRLPHQAAQVRLQTWLKSLDTLPTLPEIVLRIMALVNDPGTTVDDLEGLLISDAAIVHKLLQAVSAPALAGAWRQGEWTLKDAIVRLGLKQVGAIAQQIKLINSFARPAESGFDLHRFWEHSVGCAMVADRLYRERVVALRTEIPFNDYWIAGLLHDVGKLVLGFFFWDWFDRVVRRMQWTQSTFRDTEAGMGDAANHERISQVLVLAVGLGPELAAAVGRHHTVGDAPDDLTCLIHLANNLCKDLGLGCFPDEKGTFSKRVLRRTGLQPADLAGVRERLGSEIAQEIRELVQQCA